MMIRMSRFFPLLLAVSLSAVGIAGCGHSCNTIGCPDGLVITFGGTVSPGATFEIEMSQVTTVPEVVPIMTCSLSTNALGGPELSCSSAHQHSESGNRVQIRDHGLKKLVVTVSSGGNKVVEQMFDVSYAAEELNGPGCGICTHAAINVTIP